MLYPEISGPTLTCDSINNNNTIIIKFLTDITENQRIKINIGKFLTITQLKDSQSIFVKIDINGDRSDGNDYYEEISIYSIFLKPNLEQSGIININNF